MFYPPCHVEIALTVGDAVENDIVTIYI